MVPEFTRLQWASQEAEDVWKPRFSKICKVQNDTEVSTVLNHDRRVGMPSLSMYQFNKLKLPKGFVAKIQDVHCAPKYFGTLVQEFQEGKPFSIRTVIGRESDVDNFIELYRQGEQANCGELLGYPQCCCDFFMKTWVGDNIRDFTWRMMHVSDGLSKAVIDPYTLLNPFYMKSGVRPMWHMPCSIRCKESNELAKEYLKFWPQEEKEWLKEIFSWPVEWSSLHGAAEIRTPVCKIITDTDPESTEHVIQFAGQRIPKEAATGNRFPYGPIEDTYSNNGFYTHEAMTQSHATILAATRDIKDIKNITDPGCGNGTLLNALSLMHKVNRLSGVDLNHHAIAQGRRLYPGINFTEGNLFNHYSSADMVVFMPGRLLENPTKTDRFVKGLNFRYLLLYGYSAYADRVDDLRKQYWPDCEIRSWVINDNAVAILLERP